MLVIQLLGTAPHLFWVLTLQPINLERLLRVGDIWTVLLSHFAMSAICIPLAAVPFADLLAVSVSKPCFQCSTARTDCTLTVLECWSMYRKSRQVGGGWGGTEINYHF